jgi:cytoskeletal protein RodZ
VGQFGDKFRKAREAKGISLDDVSNVTKISSRNLQAIEQERFDQLPGGVFNRGFIRAYAKHLGLNDEEAVSDYLACLRQAQIDAHEVWDPVPAHSGPVVSHQPEPYQKPALKTHAPTEVHAQAGEELPELQLPRVEHARPPSQKYLDRGKPRAPWGLIALAAIVVLLSILLWTRRSRATHTQAANATPQSAALAQPSTASSSSNPPSEKNPAPTGNATSSTAPAPAKPNRTGEASSPQPSKAAAVKTATNTGTTQPEGTSPGKTGEASDVTVRDFTKHPAPAKPAPTMTLVIRATENSWVSVTADGQQVSQETLIAPAHTSVRAAREIVARVGNAAGVTFLFNGQEVTAQGAESEVKTFIFDADGMHEAPNQPQSQTH